VSDRGTGTHGVDATLSAADAAARVPAVAPLRPGDPRRVGPYDLLGRLGEGGMGTVYLARPDDGRHVALKVIRPIFAREEQFRSRFQREASAARRVARFCTAQVIDAGADGDVAYIVTEYIDGPTLADEVRNRGPMRGSTLDGLALGVAAALNGIHAAGIVHRDLKPSNVLLSRVGPKVIDFGIARALDPTSLDPTSLDTSAGGVVGTPAYMAPEQAQGLVSPASDVFAWGGVVAFAASGRPPFGDGSPIEVIRTSHRRRAGS
jgi:serine/threonine protein kinase